MKKAPLLFIYYMMLTLSVCIVFSCKNKNIDKNGAAHNEALPEFSRGNETAMVYSIEYYKDAITKYESDYYGFENSSMNITSLMSIAAITKADNIIPGLLTFIVCWLNQKGYVYWLYGFNNEQKIEEHYYCGDFVLCADYKKLMEKLSGTIWEYGTVAINDFNNDGKNEIALYSFYKNRGDVFCVHGFNGIENELRELCVIPVFINYDAPFPSVEYIGNGFKVLEVADEDPLALQWMRYIWKAEAGRYIKTIN